MRTMLCLLVSIGMCLAIHQAYAVPCQGPFLAGPAAISIPSGADQPVQSRIPKAAWNGAGYGVAVRGNVDGKTDIYFSLVDAAGGLVTGPVLVADTPVDTDGYARFVWTGREYGVAWSDRDAVRFMRVNAAGAPVGTETILAQDSFETSLDSLTWTGASTRSPGRISATGTSKYSSPAWTPRVSRSGERSASRMSRRIRTCRTSPGPAPATASSGWMSVVVRPRSSF